MLWCHGVSIRSSVGWRWARWAQISWTPVLKSLEYIWTCNRLQRQLARTWPALAQSHKSLLASSSECCQGVRIATSADPSTPGWALPFQAALTSCLKGRRRHVWIAGSAFISDFIPYHSSAISSCWVSDTMSWKELAFCLSVALAWPVCSPGGGERSVPAPVQNTFDF